MPGTSPEKPTYKFVIGAVAVAAFAIALIVLGPFLAQNATDAAITYLGGVFGAVLGWVIGIFLSPYSEAEQKRFSDYAKGLSAFVSGYLLSKLDKVFEGAGVAGALSDKLFAYRVMYFFSSFLLAIVVVFVVRMYPAKENKAPNGAGAHDTRDVTRSV